MARGRLGDALYRRVECQPLGVTLRAATGWQKISRSLPKRQGARRGDVVRLAHRGGGHLAAASLSLGAVARFSLLP